MQCKIKRHLPFSKNKIDENCIPSNELSCAALPIFSKQTLEYKNLIVIPHLIERLSLLCQSNQKSFRAKDRIVGQTTCQHTRQEVVGKVILDMPSDFPCHGEDKNKYLVSHETKTKAIENSWTKPKNLSRNRYFLERTCLRAAITQEVRVALFCTRKLLDDFSLHNQSTAIIKSLQPKRQVVQKRFLPQQNLTKSIIFKFK